MATIQRTTSVQTNVETLPEAWAFVMAHIDGAGPEPTVHIEPIWTCVHDLDEEPPDDHADCPVRRFFVTVSGSITIEAKAEVDS